MSSSAVCGLPLAQADPRRQRAPNSGYGAPQDSFSGNSNDNEEVPPALAKIRPVRVQSIGIPKANSNCASGV